MNLTYGRWVAAQDYYAKVVSHYGPSNHFGPYEPVLALIHDPHMTEYGGWNPEYIYVNFAKCRNMRHLVGTLIHEYWHHLQDPAWDDAAAYEAEAIAVAKADMGLFI